MRQIRLAADQHECHPRQMWLSAAHAQQSAEGVRQPQCTAVHGRRRFAKRFTR
jgi:hypothetical protein